MTQQNFKIAQVENAPSGVSTQVQTHPLGSFRDHDPSKLVTLFDDFLTQAVYTTPESYGWEINGGAPVVALIDGFGGLVSITSVAGNGTLRSQAGIYSLDPGSEFWLYGSFNISSVAGDGLDFNFTDFSSGNAIGIIGDITGTGQLYLTSANLPASILLQGAMVVPGVQFTVGLYYNPTHQRLTAYFNDVSCGTFDLSLFGGVFLAPGDFASAIFGLTGPTPATILTDFVLFSQAR